MNRPHFNLWFCGKLCPYRIKSICVGYNGTFGKLLEFDDRVDESVVYRRCKQCIDEFGTNQKVNASD